MFVPGRIDLREVVGREVLIGLRRDRAILIADFPILAFRLTEATMLLAATLTKY